MNINLTPVFETIIALLAALITYKLIPWIKSKTSAEQYANIQAATKTFCYAAEQLYGANRGPEKLRYVEAKLAEKGYSVDVDLIEATVAEYFNFGEASTIVTVGEHTGNEE